MVARPGFQTFLRLAEGCDAKSPEKVRGRTRTNRIVIFPGGRDMQGQIVEVQTQQAFLWGFLGDWPESERRS